jgi:hypothetical protein
MKREQLNSFRDRLLKLTDRAQRDAARAREQALGQGGSLKAILLTAKPWIRGDRSVLASYTRTFRPGQGEPVSLEIAGRANPIDWHMMCKAIE